MFGDGWPTTCISLWPVNQMSELLACCGTHDELIKRSSLCRATDRGDRTRHSVFFAAHRGELFCDGESASRAPNISVALLPTFARFSIFANSCADKRGWWAMVLIAECKDTVLREDLMGVAGKLSWTSFSELLTARLYWHMLRNGILRYC